jgi:hypothetical protein
MSERRAKVLVVSLNELRNDSRVLRQVEFLAPRFDVTDATIAQVFVAGRRALGSRRAKGQLARYSATRTHATSASCFTASRSSSPPPTATGAGRGAADGGNALGGAYSQRHTLNPWTLDLLRCWTPRYSGTSPA